MKMEFLWIALLLALSTEEQVCSSPTDETCDCVPVVNFVKANQALTAEEYLQLSETYCRGDQSEIDKASKVDRIVLAYVTPWNPKGKEVALRYAHKLTHVSPTWYNIGFMNSARTSYLISGSHEVDEEWIEALRKKNRKIKIVPRFAIDEWSSSDIGNLIQSRDAWNRFRMRVELTLNTVGDIVDGIVLETPGIFSFAKFRQHEKENTPHIKVFKFLRAITKTLHGRGQELHIVVAPNQLTVRQWNNLSKFVDGVSLMTYDANVATGKPGPNAPIKWMRKTVKSFMKKGNDKASLGPRKEKVLMGLNLYGWLFVENQQPEALTWDKVKEMLTEKNWAISWLKQEKEHMFTFENSLFFYPTPQSFSSRLRLAERLGVSLSLWELGQANEALLELL